MKSLLTYIFEEKIKGLNNVTTDDIIDYIKYVIEDIIIECELNSEVIDYYVHGSRVYGNPRNDSDLDVVLYYKGNMKEDALYNIFHDEDYKDQFIYDGIIIDVNPIRDQETGSLKEYIKKDKNYKK